MGPGHLIGVELDDAVAVPKAAVGRHGQEHGRDQFAAREGEMVVKRSRPMHLPNKATEDEFHLSVAELLDRVLMPPNTIWTTFPAGYGKLGRATAGRLRAKGMKKGWPDIQIFSRTTYLMHTRSIMLELKTGIGRTDGDQRRVHAALLAVGIKVYVCRTFTDVMAALEDGGIPYRRVVVSEPAARAEGGADLLSRSSV